jgi:hypothetical protein
MNRNGWTKMNINCSLVSFLVKKDRSTDFKNRPLQSSEHFSVNSRNLFANKFGKKRSTDFTNRTLQSSELFSVNSRNLFANKLQNPICLISKKCSESKKNSVQYWTNLSIHNCGPKGHNNWTKIGRNRQEWTDKFKKRMNWEVPSSLGHVQYVQWLEMASFETLSASLFHLNYSVTADCEY